MSKQLIMLVVKLKINRLGSTKYFETALCRKSLELAHVLLVNNIISRIKKNNDTYTIYLNKNIDFDIFVYESIKHSRKKQMRSVSDKHKTLYVINTMDGLEGTTDEHTKYPIWFELSLKK